MTTFGPGTLLWEWTGLHSALISASSAFVLQAMHPAIGAVVDRWSVYRSDPWGRAARSFASTQTWVYGGAEAIEESRRLRQLHKNLSAVDEQGRSHHALSAEPWAWVPLTGFHVVRMQSRYFSPRPLTDEQEDRAYQEVLDLCRLLQVQERLLPPTRRDFRVYFDDMIENTLENHPTAQNVLADMKRPKPPPAIPKALHPLWRGFGATAGGLGHFITVGTLPPAARKKLGVPWTASDERRLRRICKTIGLAESQLPERLRYLPIAYKAREAARAQQRLAEALAERPV